jgi:hypothetical protein
VFEYLLTTKVEVKLAVLINNDLTGLLIKESFIGDFSYPAGPISKMVIRKGYPKIVNGFYLMQTLSV